MPMVPVNSVVGDFKGLSNIPIRSHGTQTIFIRDVGSVEDGADIQTGYALVDGRRTVYIPVTKRADASTLAVVQAVKANLPRFQSVLPDDVEVSYQFDQSPYVTRAIQGLFVEGALGAVLTGLMVLLFLRDWRSSLVVVLNIPLAILASVTALWVSGQTINIMTLGGLALAVGILVDEATVAIENIHTRLADGRSLARAASEATAETTLPRFVAMLCILAVFIPAFFMTGAAHTCSYRWPWQSASRWWGRICYPAPLCRYCRSGCCAIRARTTSRKKRSSIGCVPRTIGSREPS